MFSKELLQAFTWSEYTDDRKVDLAHGSVTYTFLQQSLTVLTLKLN